jgi:uncharacterized membrane-anchored protein YitT (DUF2179 family)
MNARRKILEIENYINRNNMKNIALILFGSLISAISINMFIVHANLLSGGLSGVSLIIQYLIRFPAGYTVLLLNIPLFVISYKKNSKRFTAMTLLGTISLSIFLIITNSFRDILSLNDPLLLSIYGGVLNGAGIGLVLSNHGSTGGLDIISVLVKKKYENFDIGATSFAINFVIVCVGAIWFGLSSALYTLVSMYITGYVTDKMIKGFNRQKMILIITQKEEEVSKAIMKSLKRGITFLYGEGAYTMQERKVLYCVVSLSQLPQLKLIVRATDENAFISILDVSEVQGKGFKGSLF